MDSNWLRQSTCPSQCIDSMNSLCQHRQHACRIITSQQASMTLNLAGGTIALIMGLVVLQQMLLQRMPSSCLSPSSFYVLLPDALAGFSQWSVHQESDVYAKCSSQRRVLCSRLPRSRLCPPGTSMYSSFLLSCCLYTVGDLLVMALSPDILTSCSQRRACAQSMRTACSSSASVCILVRSLS